MVGLCCAWLQATPLAGQEDDDVFAPGLIGRYSSGPDATLTRRDPAIAFAWRDRSPDPRLSAGPFRVQWTGFLRSQATGEYRLHLYAAGKIRVKLGDRELMEAFSPTPQWHSSSPIQLDFDYHPLQLDFEGAADTAQISLFWEGPQFQLEPLDSRQLYHLREQTPSQRFERGAELVRALRCESCHVIGTPAESLAAPSLEFVGSSLNRDWLVEWLSGNPVPQEEDNANEQRSGISRRMPHFAISRTEAEAITAWLFEESRPVSLTTTRKKSTSTAKKTKTKKGEPEPPPQTPVERGRELFLTTGCVACHGLDEDAGGLFGGGDLGKIVVKRPAKFFETWLAEPQRVNPQHRMPVFDLQDEERRNLAAYLSTLGAPAATVRRDGTSRGDAAELLKQGERAVARYRCASCHTLPQKNSAPEAVAKKVLDAKSDWSRSCLSDTSAPPQPHYSLTAADRESIQEFVAHSRGTTDDCIHLGRRLVVENNCQACHQRNEAPGLAARLVDLAARYTELADRIPLVTPPPLNSVGDKLHDQALQEAIARKGEPHRPYLLIRMPRFKLRDAELQAILHEFVSSDRIPTPTPSAPPPPPTIDPALLTAVGSRLVTTDGFGCTSCHQIGSVLPVKAPLNARGPDLSLLEKRLRREWYERWVRNPARIVPRMEMPSVQIPVRGVLDDNLSAQLAAVWDVLNQPGFEPPLPNPVRTVRHTGTHPEERAVVITDVLRSGKEVYVKPLLVGLSNRHNILFDLATARLVHWSTGDTARQRTEGKTWFWEDAGHLLLTAELAGSEVAVTQEQLMVEPESSGQFLTEFESYEHDGPTFRFNYQLQFGGSIPRLKFAQEFTPVVRSRRSGFLRTFDIPEIPADLSVTVRIVGSEVFARGTVSDDGRIWTAAPPIGLSIAVHSPDARFTQDGSIVLASGSTSRRLRLEYTTDFAVDQFLVETPLLPAPKPEALQVVPGFSSHRLPLTDDIMPTALSWRPDGTLVIASLKGQVWQAFDTDDDQLEDRMVPFSDELAAPYGLFAAEDYIDVINKYALLRLFDDDRDGRADRTVTLASGWGHTTDYHDWAVGLPRDAAGNYYIALPCQQDDRSVAAARLRGHFLKLVPRPSTPENPRPFVLKTISRGHRFPMGIALRRDGELFVSDNQGNYNPFNEINHVREGAHFGFINAIERSKTQPPPVDPPAINLPHPWVRSVNGICFLESPASAEQPLPKNTFGPFQGHLIGCEYDTRRLVRMSFQQVGDVVQGAAYPFSYDQPQAGPPFLGPLTCEVAPDGNLYVGGIRDSGWGGANNIGEVVRLRFEPAQLPCGIAEMRATADGFELEFTSPVVAERARQLASYSLASYRRESTPAYGGPDLDVRTEQIQEVSVSDDGRLVTLKLPELRPGYVYELHVKSLAAEGQPFFPAEAHFTLHRPGP